MYTYSPAFSTLSRKILGQFLDPPNFKRQIGHYKIIKIRSYRVVKGIHYSDSGCVDVYCTMGVEVDALSLRLRASTSNPIVQQTSTHPESS